MTSKTRFEKLLEPGYIGKLKIRNRIIKTCGGAEDVTEYNQAFCEALAKGGVGLIMAGDCAVDYPLGITLPMTRRSLEDDKYIPAWAKLVEVMHKHDTPTFLQLFHAGPQARLRPGLQTVSSSALTESEAKDLDAPMVPRELTIAEIEELIDKFASAAVRAEKAGFDGVEVNAARMHLDNSFLSRAWNKRKDKYGTGSLENRARFVVEIIREIKKRLGQDFPVSALINAVEVGADEGITLEEGLGFARLMEQAGADIIFARAFGYRGWGSINMAERAYYSGMRPLPEGFDWSHKGAGALVPLAAAVKEVVSIPVYTVGRINPVLGERTLREGKADFIGMCRSLMADPEIPNKIASGRLDDIVPCPACGVCTMSFGWIMMRDPEFEPIRCRINAALGTKQEYEIRPATTKKKVVVVGGGPGGMEAARVAAIRGHEVILYEKERELGGLLPWVAAIKGLDMENDATVVADYLKNQITKLGVNIKLGKKFTPALIDEIKPDAVILAPGRIPVIPEIPGIKRRNVISADELYRKFKPYLRPLGPEGIRRLTKDWLPIGKKVVIMGVTVEGLTLADFLINQGRKVTIVDTADIQRSEVLARMMSPSRQKMTIMGEVKYEEITKKGLIITTKEGERQTIEADTIVPALYRIDTEFLEAFRGKTGEIKLIGGDGEEPNFIMNAIRDGYLVAEAI